MKKVTSLKYMQFRLGKGSSFCVHILLFKNYNNYLGQEKGHPSTFITNFIITTLINSSYRKEEREEFETFTNIRDV